MSNKKIIKHNYRLIFSKNNKFINEFYFLLNLAKIDVWQKYWHDYYVGSSFDFNVEEEKIKKIAEIFLKKSYWDLEEIFYYAKNEKDLFVRLEHIYLKDDMIELRKAFFSTKKEFNNFYNNIQKKYIDELTLAWEKPKYKNILRKLIIFFGDSEKVSSIFVKPVFLDRFEGVLRGRAFENIVSITIPVDAIKNNDKLNNIFLVLLHELTHVFVRNNKEIRQAIKSFGVNTKIAEDFHNKNRDFNSFVEEILIRMFVPKGYFFDHPDQINKNIKNSSALKDFKNKQSSFDEYERVAFDKMHNDIKNYVLEGKKIDEKFLTKFLSVFKK